MNLKRTFGAILTILGIVGLIYAGIAIVQHSSSFTNITVFGIIGLLFFLTGISLIRTTRDDA